MSDQEKSNSAIHALFLKALSRKLRPGVVSAAVSSKLLYSTVPRARPPETLQEQPFPTHDEW